MEWKRATEGEQGLTIPDTWLFVHYYDTLNVLFRIENALRILVYVILKNDMQNKWVDISISSDEAAETTIGALAKKRIAQHEAYGYLGYTIEAPIMHLTSGELIRLITSDAYWPLFKDYFRASKQVVSLKLQEIGDIRNALAHFRPLTPDDADSVKQNAKHVLSSVEEALGAMVKCSQRVPTNTGDAWYQDVRTLGTQRCRLAFTQSADQRWIRFHLRFTASIVAQDPATPEKWVQYSVFNLDSPSVLNRYDDLRRLVVYLTERVSHSTMPADLKPAFFKTLEFTFSQDSLAKDHEQVRACLVQLLEEIDNEAELISEDNLAKGKLVHLVLVRADKQQREDRQYWIIQVGSLRSPFKSHHPTEYWGSINLPGRDLISDCEQFPWMPETICEVAIPF